MKIFKFSILLLVLVMLFSFVSLADYEDGVSCEYCGGWRYDDWKCDDGDHCGQDADGSCYEDHHCGNCGACQSSVEYICSCGNGCSECSVICPECSEKCEACADDQLCSECGVCWDCIGGEGNYCESCSVCKNCAEMVCYCGNSCTDCAVICSSCGEKCDKCADDQLCVECGLCWDCVGGEGNYCAECSLCKNCVEYVCYCGNGCSSCTVVCPGCSEKCESCADDQLCSECGMCWDCVGGEGNYCTECGVCKNCVEMVCYCGGGCSDCAVVCPGCGEKCESCADDQLCSECGMCWDCVGGEGHYCEECGICKNCVEYICYCGKGCSDCATVCPECGEKCTNCADEEICGGCNVCKDCVGGDGNFCDKCETCINCAEYVCYCGGGCSECAVVCPECNEACENCSDELCTSCGKCISCSEADGWCGNCMLCADCVETCSCGYSCVECNDLCQECLEHCPECYDEFCTSCDICRECAGDDRWCEECGNCGECVTLCDDCGLICVDCAESYCEECGVCADCKSEVCPDCGICSDCADAMCSECYYCYECAAELCVKCEEYCSSCVDFCEECLSCVNCVEVCPTCELCADCCAEYSESLGCEHGVCSKSNEWKMHYCEDGEHCVEKSEMESDEEHHWFVCGDECDVRLAETLHAWGNGQVKTEATSVSEGVLVLTCSVCGYEKMESIPKTEIGHTHEYEVTVVEATCVDGGYTTHTCECGYGWIDGMTEALEHKYVMGYSEAEHFMRCEICSKMQKNQSHILGKWTVVKKAGYTFEGLRARKCTKCDYSLTEPIAMLEVPENKVVISLPVTVKPVEKNEDASGTEEKGKAPVEAELSEREITELLTTGSANRVPTLPVLAPKEDGSLFEGWADKKTGLMVSKGDRILESIELVPVWKDCGDGNHIPNDDGSACGECGIVLTVTPPAEEVPDETDKEELSEDEKPEGDSNSKPEESKGFPTAVIIAMAGGVLAIAGTGLAVYLKKKKK